ncbi:MAG: acyl-CoA dehydrogenase family protein [Gammaproteobacteria bacterium]
MAIDITLSEEQEIIRRSARDFFSSECDTAFVRRAEVADEDFPRAMWKQMAELGWLGMSFPEQYDGAGCTLLDLYPLYLELGRHIVPLPLLECVGLAAWLVAAAGNEAQRQRILPAVAAGDMILAPALMEAQGIYGPRGIAMQARRAGAGFVLDGTKLLVPCASAADLLAVACRTGAPGGEAGVTLFLVDPHARGVSVESTPTMTGERMYAVSFDRVEVGAADVLGEVDRGWAPLDDAIMRAAILQAALAAGGAERVMEISTGYARDRVQFGKPIGSNQAVQYLCTEIAIETHRTRLLTMQAAWCQATGRPWKREAALAKAAACRAAVAAIHGGHEVHAGIGFMVDYDLQLFTRRAKHWEWNLGDYRYHLERSLVEAGI